MKTYKLKDGGVITATSSEDFITKLRESSKFDSAGSDQEFMERFINRLNIYDTSKIRTETPEVFIEDLKRTGFIL